MRHKRAAELTPVDRVHIDPRELADLIGLSRPELLGRAPISLPAATAEMLRAHGGNAELTTADVGAILGIGREMVSRYCTEEDRPIRMVHRRRLGTTILVAASDLAAFIGAKNTTGPVPTTQAERKRYDREAAAIVRDACDRHRLNIKLPPK